MVVGDFTVALNSNIAKKIYKAVLFGKTSGVTRPGQFVNIALDGYFLRRPISVCDINGQSLTLIYKVVGDGTERISRIRPGEKVNLITGLGNGFDTSKSGANPLVIGGGVGIPPLYFLCKKLTDEGKKTSVVLGFTSAEEAFYINEFVSLGVSVEVYTNDGSLGKKGYATDGLERKSCSYFYACGPKPMLRAVAEKTDKQGQFSLEERMGCGFGACMGCSIRTKNGSKRVCMEGPVFEKDEIIW